MVSEKNSLDKLKNTSEMKMHEMQVSSLKSLFFQTYMNEAKTSIESMFVLYINQDSSEKQTSRTHTHTHL